MSSIFRVACSAGFFVATFACTSPAPVKNVEPRDEKKVADTKPETKTPVRTTPDVAPTTAVTGPRPPVEPKAWTFDTATPGPVPPGFSVRQTGEFLDPSATWEVVADDDAPSGKNVFGITKSAGQSKTYNFVIIEGTSYRDLEISVALKAVGGTNNQGGGVIFRVKSEGDHYVARWNPVEKNFRVYAMLGGARLDIASAPLELEADTWHALKVVVTGDEIECFVDDTLIVQATDKALPDAGMIGLWAKGDATTLFDDLIVSAR